MIDSIELKNFKGIQEGKIDMLSKINIIMGKNNSNKSTFFQALFFLKNSIVNKNFNWELNPFLFKDYSTNVYNHEIHKSITINVGIKLDEQEIEEIGIFFGKINKINYSLEIINGNFIRSEKIFFDGKLLFKYERRYDVKNGYYIYKESDVAFFINDYKIRIELDGFNNQIPLYWNIGKLSNFGINEKTSQKSLINLMNEDDFKNFLDIIQRIIICNFENMEFILPERSVNRWSKPLSNENTKLLPNGSNTIDILTTLLSERDEKYFKIQDWMNRIGGHIQKMKNPIRNAETSIVFIENHIENNILSMGTGFNKVIPIVTLSVISKPNSMLLIEEPELNLHYKAISILNDMFYNISKQSQIFIITHSYDLLLDLRKKLQNHKFEEDKFSFYLFKKNNKLIIKKVKFNSIHREWYKIMKDALID